MSGPGSFFDTLYLVFTEGWWSDFFHSFLTFMDWLRPYSTVLSLLMLSGIVYAFLRLERVAEETVHDDHAHAHEGEGSLSSIAMAESTSGKRWERVENHMTSGKESDWRLAILEADVLLDEMLTHMGYRGDSLGEKLKGIEKSDFTTIGEAWEAHAVRNKIAHEGAAFALSEREARRIIGLYETVFKEFHYI